MSASLAAVGVAVRTTIRAVMIRTADPTKTESRKGKVESGELLFGCRFFGVRGGGGEQLLAVDFGGDQIGLEIGEHLAGSFQDIGLPAITITHRANRDAANGAVGDTAAATQVELPFFEPHLDQERDGAIGGAAHVRRILAGDSQQQVTFFNLLDFGVIVGHEAAHLFDDHVERHRGGERLLDQVVGLFAAEPGEPTPGLRWWLFARTRPTRAELHDAVAAVFFGLIQTAIGPAEHCFGCITTLNFGHAKAGGHTAAVERGERQFREFCANFVAFASGTAVVAIAAEHDELFAAVTGHEIASAAIASQQGCKVDEHFVTGLMAEGVVHLFEMVDVADDQAARQIPLHVIGNSHREEAIELGAVGNLREWVASGSFMQRLDALFERDLRRGVVHQHRSAERHAIFAVHRDHMRVDFHHGLVAAGDREAFECLSTLTNGLNDGAIVFFDQLVAVVAQTEERRRPVLVFDARCSDAGEPFGGAIPEHDAQRAVDEDHRVVHVFEQPLLKHTVARAVGAARRLRQLPEGVDLVGVQLLEPTPSSAAVQFHHVGRQVSAELTNELWIELHAGEFKQFSDGPFTRQRAAINLIAGHRIESIDDGENAGAERELFAAEVVAFATAIEPGAGVMDNIEHRRRGGAVAKNLDANPAVIFDNQVFVASQFARLEQDAIGHADLADVVQKRSKFDFIAQLIGQLQQRGPGRATHGHAQRVSCRRGMFGAECGKQTTSQTQTNLNELIFKGLLGGILFVGIDLIEQVGHGLQTSICLTRRIRGGSGSVGWVRLIHVAWQVFRVSHERVRQCPQGGSGCAPGRSDRFVGSVGKRRTHPRMGQTATGAKECGKRNYGDFAADIKEDAGCNERGWRRSIRPAYENVSEAAKWVGSAAVRQVSTYGGLFTLRAFASVRKTECQVAAQQTVGFEVEKDFTRYSLPIRLLGLNSPAESGNRTFPLGGVGCSGSGRFGHMVSADADRRHDALRLATKSIEEVLMSRSRMSWLGSRCALALLFMFTGLAIGQETQPAETPKAETPAAEAPATPAADPPKAEDSKADPAAEAHATTEPVAAATTVAVPTLESVDAKAQAALLAANNSWMLTSSALVLFMTAPGLAMFYSGLVRKKNVLGVMMQCVFLMGLMTVLWALYGYSLSFGGTNKYIGNGDYLFMKGVQRYWDEKAGAPVTPLMNEGLPNVLPRLTHMVFQGMFFIITPALICGAFAERMKFSTMVVFSILWGTLIYCPLCHWVWGGGFLAFKTTDAMGESLRGGALDFAGGAVVHISSGVSALICALVMGKRLGYGTEPMPPHNLTYTCLGAAMLWVGWFGFNAGSELASDELTSSAFVTTHFSAAAGTLAWALMEWITRGKPSVLGACSGAVAGLVCITPAAGFVNPMEALAMGTAGGVVCFFACTKLKAMFGYDDSLDAFGVHGVGGTLGAILTGVFATRACWNVDGTNTLGLYEGQSRIFIGQLAATAVTWVFSAVVCFILLKVLDVTMGLRVSKDEEMTGLDLSQHGEEGYISL
jgi:Amt family ammonium transporter